MLPEVEEYFATKQRLHDELRACVTPGSTDALYEAHDRYVAGVEKAWDKMAQDTRDPVAKWTASSPFREYVLDYIEEVEEVLRILPATIEQIDELAAQEGWCGEYDRLRTEAKRSGVFALLEYKRPGVLK